MQSRSSSHTSFVHSITAPVSLALLGGSAVAIAFIGWLVGPQDYRYAQRGMGNGMHDTEYVGDVRGGGGGPLPPHHMPPALEEAENRKNEEKLQEMMAQLNHYVSINLPRAEKLAEQILEFAEKAWSKNHINYGLLLGLPIANVFEIKGDRKAYEECLKSSAKILKNHGEEYLVEMGIAEKLVNVYSGQNDYKKAVEYALMVVKGRRENLRASPVDVKTAELFCVAAAKAGVALSNAGMFKQAEAHFKESLKVIGDTEPTSHAAYIALEFWTNTLHQQGKTQEAIIKLEEYKRKVINLHGEGPNMVRKILHRAAILWFTVDKFSETLEYLTELVRYSEEKHLPVSLQMWCELATAYWELDKPDQAREIQARMRDYHLSLTSNIPPLTRSKYLSTMDCLLVDEMYTFSMRINREQPKRKEGDIVEEPDKIKRKAETCFLEVTFEATHRDGDSSTITKHVDKPHQFQIQSPKMGPIDPGRFYEVVIDVYTDSSKNKKLGTHHQLVYGIPNPAYIGRSTSPF